MATQYPAINDNDVNLLKKIVNNTALLADTEAGDVASIAAGSGISVSQPTGAVTITNSGVLSIAGTANRVTASQPTGAVVLDISAAYVGQASITTLGTIATGVWNATAIADGKIASALTGKTYNGLTVTATTGTLTITNLKVLTVSNTLTLTATDGSTLAIGTGGTLGTAAYTAATAYAASGAVTASGLTMTTARLLGRTTALTGAIEELTVGTSLSLSAGSINAIQDIRTSASPTWANVTTTVAFINPVTAVGAPSIYWGVETDTGWYRDVANVIRGAVSGIRKMSLTAANLQLTFGTTTAASPSLTINAAGNSGLFSPASGTVGISCAGTEGANFTATALTLAGSVTTSAPNGGTAAAWKLGVVAAVSPTAPNRTIEVDVAGTRYFVAAKTTND